MYWTPYSRKYKEMNKTQEINKLSWAYCTEIWKFDSEEGKQEYWAADMDTNERSGWDNILWWIWDYEWRWERGGLFCAER